jgi:hypothetical protein
MPGDVTGYSNAWNRQIISSRLQPAASILHLSVFSARTAPLHPVVDAMRAWRALMHTREMNTASIGGCR